MEYFIVKTRKNNCKNAQEMQESYQVSYYYCSQKQVGQQVTDNNRQQFNSITL